MNASTPAEFAECISCEDGITNVLVLLGQIETKNVLDKEQSIPNITKYHDFEFHDSGMLVRRHSKVGRGKAIRLFEVPPAAEFIYNVVGRHDNLRPLHQKLLQYHFVGEREDREETEGQPEDAHDPSWVKVDGAVFKCNKMEGCCAEYLHLSCLQNHLAGANCIIKEQLVSDAERVTAMYVGKHGISRRDRPATTRDARRFVHRVQNVPFVEVPPAIPRVKTVIQETYKEGFALHQSKKHTRLTEKQESYLKEHFLAGQKSGRKVKANHVEHEMRRAKSGDPPTFIFSPDEWLTEKQIMRYFSKLAASLKKNTRLMEPTEAEVDEAEESLEIEVQAAEKEQLFDEINQGGDDRDEDDPHPITVSSTNELKKEQSHIGALFYCSFVSKNQKSTSASLWRSFGKWPTKRPQLCTQ